MSPDSRPRPYRPKDKLNKRIYRTTLTAMDQKAIRLYVEFSDRERAFKESGLEEFYSNGRTTGKAVTADSYFKRPHIRAALAQSNRRAVNRTALTLERVLGEMQEIAFDSSVSARDRYPYLKDLKAHAEASDVRDRKLGLVEVLKMGLTFTGGVLPAVGDEEKLKRLEIEFAFGGEESTLNEEGAEQDGGNSGDPEPGEDEFQRQYAAECADPSQG